jgi:hypothetical protein
MSRLTVGRGSVHPALDDPAGGGLAGQRLTKLERVLPDLGLKDGSDSYGTSTHFPPTSMTKVGPEAHSPVGSQVIMPEVP